MSDQSSLNAGVAANAAAPAEPVAAPAWDSLDLIDKVNSLNSRLSAIENAPAPVASVSGEFSESRFAALKRVVKTVFGDELE